MGGRNRHASKFPSQGKIGNPRRPATLRNRNVCSASIITAATAVTLFTLRPAVASPPLDVSLGIDTFIGTYTVTAGAVPAGSNGVIIENTGELQLMTRSHLVVQDNGADDNTVVTNQGILNSMAALHSLAPLSVLETPTTTTQPPISSVAR